MFPPVPRKIFAKYFVENAEEDCREKFKFCVDKGRGDVVQLPL